MKTVSEFQGEYRVLSNFWPCYLKFRDLEYPTAEHAYQAAKVEDPFIKQKIRDCGTPAEAKDYFETKGIKADPGWTTEKKLDVMEEILMIKFGGKEPLLTRALLATGDRPLIEGNTRNDHFWGVCNDHGENNLGKILMKIRAELFRQKDEILEQLELKHANAIIAKNLSITTRSLYERMVAFKIQNKEFWIS